MTRRSSNPVSDLIRRAWNRGEPAGWFEELYAGARDGEGRVPWAQMAAHPDFADWAARESLDGGGKSALVIGCGLGDDAEFLAELGFSVTAFDISATAIAWAKERFPDTRVDYQVADLFKTPEAWRHAYDFVLESRTIQALPYDLAPQTIAQIAGFVAPGGSVLVLCHAREEATPAQGIPWPLARSDLAQFTAAGLGEVQVEALGHGARFRAVYRRAL